MAKKKIFINAGYTIFEVKEDSNLYSKAKLYGETDLDDHIITIQGGLPGKVYKEIFWHEFMHLVTELSGYGGHPEHEDAAIGATTNEELVTRLTRSFITLMSLNPELKEML